MKKAKIIKVVCLLMPLAFASCATTEPPKMDLPIQETAPEQKVTRFSETMKDFGLMLEIYRQQPMKVMIKEVVDKTGASVSTGSEIQQNITEIVKSTLNSMGENVVFIEYDPEFVALMQQTGYSEFGDKLIPNVVVTGAITEFDRALQSWEKGTDAGAEADFSHVKSWLPSQSVAVDYSDSTAANKARITVDFNLKNFQTLAGVPGMNVVNTMEVQKAMAKKEFGITLFGPTFGTSGSLKKVQGRHDAIRLLVQSGMVQLVGRYAGVPYWRLFGEGAVSDEMVLKSWRREFPRLSEADRVGLMQQYLYLHGYDLTVNGRVDGKTKAAFSDFMSKNGVTEKALNVDVFLKIYLSVPINENVYLRAQELNAAIAQAAQADAGGGGVQQASGDVRLEDIGKAGNLMTAGYSYFKQGDYLKASQLFDESIKASPTSVGYYFLAMSYQSMEDKPRAISSLEEGVKQFRNDFPLWKALGMSYNEAGNSPKAKEAFTAASTLKPNDRQVIFMLERTQ